MTANFGQHDSGSGQHDFGRDDFRVTRPVTAAPDDVELAVTAAWNLQQIRRKIIIIITIVTIIIMILIMIMVIITIIMIT